ncbi:amino acid ABC transporter substrate-binding protein [Rhizobium sp. NXC14]|nr:amino acid ABC transporter substrate-binding protein [Rhizobium sp. NXC14]
MEMHNNRRQFLGMALATAAFVTVGAAAASAATVEEIKAKGTIVVGIQGDNAPWGFVNTSGKQDGFDADVATLFARELGVKVQFQPLAVANRIPALTTGKVDILFATMAMTEERAKSIQYSKPYAANTISLYAAKADTAKTPADIAGWEIGVPKSSSQDKAITDAVGSTATVRRSTTTPRPFRHWSPDRSRPSEATCSTDSGSMPPAPAPTSARSTS